MKNCDLGRINHLKAHQLKYSFIFLTAIVFMTNVSYGQDNNIFQAGGNVGIGTTSPTTRLQVSGTLSAVDLANALGTSTPVIFGSVSNAYPTFGVSMNHVVEDPGTNVYGMALLSTDSYLTGRTEKVRITGSGNVGIGTKTPNTKLQVSGTLSAIDLVSTLGASTPVIYGSIGGAYPGWGVSINHVVEDVGSNHYGMALLTTDNFLTGRTEKMRIAANGNVGIGTAAPDSKLSVNGVIHSKSVKVDMNNWPDYVFKPKYDLLTLNEVKSYIIKNQHLPEMPSAVEIETNGLNLGDMNKLLTKKVEELTLYLLEKDTEVSTLKSDLGSLEKRYSDQQSQLNAIKDMLDQLKKAK